MKNKIIITTLITLIIILGYIFISTVISYYTVNNKVHNKTDKVNTSSKAEITYKENATVINVDDDSSIRIIKKYDENMFKGKKSLVFFWASWCSHCKEEYDVVKNVITNYQNKEYNIYLISHDYELEELADFMKNNDLNYEVCFDEQRVIRAHFDPEASSVPLTYIIDENANLIDSFNGPITLDEVNSLIDKNM